MKRKGTTQKTKHTLPILLALLLAKPLPAVAQTGQPVQPPGPEQIRSVGRIAVSERPPVPAVTGGDAEGWMGGEVLPFTPPEKPMADVPMRDMDVSRGPDGTYYLTGTAADSWRGKLRQSPPAANPSATSNAATAPIPQSTAFARAGDDPSSADNSSVPDNAEKIVSRCEGVWTAPPRRIPSNAVSDAPMLGNGDLGVLVGGATEKQTFYISKCDLGRPQPYFPWFTPALVGALDLEIPALKGAGYKAVQDMAKAEVRQTFTRADGTVEMRSWTPASGHD
jgi:hypothetical protein